MARPKIMSGAEIFCFINGRRFANVSGFKFSARTTRRPIQGLDSGQPYELAPTVTSVVGTLNLWRTIGDGGAEGVGIVAFFEDLPREKYFSILLTERGSDTVFFKADYCSLQEQSWDVPIKGLVAGTFTFEALSWENEVRSFRV